MRRARRGPGTSPARTFPAARAIAEGIEQALRREGNPERARQEKRYVKSSLEHLGATVPATRRATLAVRRSSPEIDRATVLGAVERLWARRIFECRMAAVDLLELFLDRLLPEDLALVERLLRESGTWALVDSLAASVAGPLAGRLPRSDRTLERWAKDPDFWIRRSALLALLLPLREGRGDLARFGRLADPMLEEKEFFVRKAIGWVLRDAGKGDPAGVAAWLLPRAARASGLTVREAVRYLPAARRAEILAAHRGRARARSRR
jgi:3-methyladenine DNA glycosylase AlkD